jgi:ABC-2 type transport system permease protein
VIPAARLNGPQAFLAALAAASRVKQKSWASNSMLLVQGLLGSAVGYLGLLMTYRISGQTAVPGNEVEGFLVVSLLATGIWGSTVWSCGFALSMDAHEGTLPTILASPANMTAVVMGYGLGSIVWTILFMAPPVAIGFGFGAEYDLAQPALVVATVAMLFASALVTGAALAGLFVLSRNANSLANFFQTPIYILAGFYFPRSVLPGWLEPVGAVLPVTHALEAFRASLLSGAGWGDVGDSIGWWMLASAGFLLVGRWSLGRVDHELRRTGSLNLF